MKGCWVEQPKLQTHALSVELLSRVALEALDSNTEPGCCDLSHIRGTPAHCWDAIINTVFFLSLEKPEQTDSMATAKGGKRVRREYTHSLQSLVALWTGRKELFVACSRKYLSRIISIGNILQSQVF